MYWSQNPTESVSWSFQKYYHQKMALGSYQELQLVHLTLDIFSEGYFVCEYFVIFPSSLPPLYLYVHFQKQTKLSLENFTFSVIYLDR